MLRTHGGWKDNQWTSFAQKLLNDDTTQGFRLAEITQRHIFHLDAEIQSSPKRTQVMHLIANHIEDVVPLLLANGYVSIRVNIQSAYDPESDYKMSQIIKIMRGYDEDGVEMYVCECRDGQKYYMPKMLVESNSNSNHFSEIWTCTAI